MTTIYCTRKLETFIATETNKPDILHSDREWNAHLVAIGGRKCTLIIDKKTLYGLLIVDILKKDLKNIDAILYSAFIQQLKYDPRNWMLHTALCSQQYGFSVLTTTGKQ